MARIHACTAILDALVATLEQIPELDGCIKRTRSRSHGETLGVSVMASSWEPQSEKSSGKVTAIFDVDIFTSVAGTDEDLDADSLRADGKINNAIMSDETLGLRFVLSAEKLPWTTESSAEAEVATASGDSRYRFKFQYHKSNIEVEV